MNEKINMFDFYKLFLLERGFTGIVYDTMSQIIKSP